MRANEFIVEGGNVQIGDVEAQRIDLTKLNRDTMVPIIAQALTAINAGYASMFKQPLWNTQLIKSNKFLSGSSFHFFNTVDIPTAQFVAKKPTVGDIDTQVDKTMAINAEQFLTASKGKTFGPATLIGFKKSVDQLITLWAFRDPPLNIQIDLEFVDYEKGEPTEWSTFSHSSAWEDMEQGIKGVFHKYLLRALSTPSLRDVVILSGKKQTPKVVKTTDLAFAVTKGLRYKIAPVMDGSKQQTLNGLKVYQEIPTKESTYVTNLYEMCKIFFGKKFNQADLQKFWSYVGGLELVKKYFTAEQQAGVILGFAYTLYGPGAQELYRGEPERDAADKQGAFDLMIKTLNVPYDKSTVDALRKDYYSK